MLACFLMLPGLALICRSPLSRAALGSRIVILSTTYPIEAGICKLAGLGDTACKWRPTMGTSRHPVDSHALVVGSASALCSDGALVQRQRQ